MTFVAPGIFPHLGDIFGVDKFQTLRRHSRHGAVGSALRRYDVASGAFMSYRLVFRVHVGAVVASCAARPDEMPDIIRVDIPADFHFGKYIRRKFILHRRDGAVDYRSGRILQIGIIALIEILDRLRNSGHRFVFCIVFGGHRFDRCSFYFR